MARRAKHGCVRLVALFLLTACAAQQPLQPQTVLPSASVLHSGPLLYVSSFGNFDVYVYSIPSLNLVERLSGFNEPQGECSDAAGNLWIANTGTQQMLKFAPLARKPSATLTDSVGYPVGCAVDARTGDLAVTDIFGTSGQGGILIYRNAAGTPKLYADSTEYYYYFAAYDDKDDLYTSGLTFGNVYSLSLLPRGARSMETVAIRGATLHYPGSVIWSESRLLLGDQECRGVKTSCLYEGSTSGRSVSIAKSISLTGSCDVAQVAIASSQMFGGDRCSKDESRTQRWTFPAGGKPSKSVAGVKDPIGAAIVNP